VQFAPVGSALSIWYILRRVSGARMSRLPNLDVMSSDKVVKNVLFFSLVNHRGPVLEITIAPRDIQASDVVIVRPDLISGLTEFVKSVLIMLGF
jgi:hypothetical protein